MIINNIQPYLSFTQKNDNKNTTKTSAKIKAAAGSIVGTAIPLIFMMKKRKINNPFKIDYNLQDMIVLSGSAVCGGVCAGIVGEDKKARKHKLKEGVFQFLNASIPTWIVGGVLKLPEGSRKFNNPPAKILSLIGGLVVGMFGAAKISNLIFDPKDREPDRKLTFKDALANFDDVIGALVLARVPIISKLKLEKTLPFIFAYCGYRAGKTD